MLNIGATIFLEGTVDGEARVLALGANWGNQVSTRREKNRIGRCMRTLLETLPAEFTLQAGAGKPLDADTVAELDWRVGGVCANSDNMTDTLDWREILAAA